MMFLLACAPLRDDNYMVGWIGMPISSISSHSYFGKLPRRIIKRSEHWMKFEYREADNMRTKVDCEVIGGCVGLQYLSECVYEFEVENTIVTAATLHGKCKKDPRLLPEL